MTSQKAKRVKLTIVGDGSTGKTCLLMVYKDEKFPSEYVPTVFENYVKYVTFEDKPIELVLWIPLARRITTALDLFLTPIQM